MNADDLTLTGVRRSAGFSLLLAMALLVSGSPPARAEFSLFKSKSKSREAQAATAARLKEIDQATKGFADRYVTYLSDACDKAAKDNPDYEARKQALRLKLHSSTSVYDIAASPNPLGQLLDLCVVVTLQKMNWVEEGRAQKILGTDHSAPVIKIFSDAYVEVWELAGRFLTPAEISETKKLIREWRSHHKDVGLLPFVRFDDFAKARAGVEQQNPVVKGLFAQIGEANRSIQTVTDFGEQALFYTERMPRLLQWQTERTVQAVLENPELQRTLASVEQVSNTVAEETRKLDQRQEEFQKTLDQVNQITVNGKALVVEARQTGETLTGTFTAFDQLMHTINAPPVPGETPKAPGRPFDITEYGPVFEKATGMAREARLFVDSSLQLESASAFNARMSEVEAFTQRRMNHIALRIAQLIVFFFAMLFLTRWLCAKCFGPNRAAGNPPPASSPSGAPGE